MLGNLWDYSVLSRHQIERLKNWSILKQSTGFHGRVNKDDDTCYAFWIGATLSVLLNLIINNKINCFILDVGLALFSG